MGDLIRLLPYFEWAKEGTNIARHTTNATGEVTQIWREYKYELFEITDFGREFKGWHKNITYRNPILEVINNKTAKILEFKNIKSR